jgi:hypothetical protein
MGVVKIGVKAFNRYFEWSDLQFSKVSVALDATCKAVIAGLEKCILVILCRSVSLDIPRRRAVVEVISLSGLSLRNGQHLLKLIKVLEEANTCILPLCKVTVKEAN